MKNEMHEVYKVKTYREKKKWIVPNGFWIYFLLDQKYKGVICLLSVCRRCRCRSRFNIGRCSYWWTIRFLICLLLCHCFRHFSTRWILCTTSWFRCHTQLSKVGGLRWWISKFLFIFLYKRWCCWSRFYTTTNCMTCRPVIVMS